MRSLRNPNLIYKWNDDLVLGDLCEEKAQLRHHIVWFGEEVPLLDKAIELTRNADILMIIGTSMQVYPAANLINYTNSNIPIYFIDPNPQIQQNYYSNLTVLSEKAGTGVRKVVSQLIP